MPRQGVPGMDVPSSAIRVAHFSDIHITTPIRSWKTEDWFNKRFAAWVNLRLLGRGHRFRHAERFVEALNRDLEVLNPDHLIFSGDATAMGFPEEMERAASLLPIGIRPGLAVPGNHDYCTASAKKSQAFEQQFAPWQQGERLDGNTYPFAQRVGPVWFVAVNSAAANRWAWDARGEVTDPQLGRLELLLERLDDAPRILVTHYPIMLANGRPERAVRALRDLDQLVDVATRGRVSLWLHGHRHDWFFHPANDRYPFPIVCAGSATQNGRWSYSDIQIESGRLQIAQRSYDETSQGFKEARKFDFHLPRASRVVV